MSQLNRSNSEKLFETSSRYFPGGVNSPVRAFRSVGGTPIFIKRGDGCTLWDEDDNQYIDFFIKYGIFGIFGFILFLFWGIRNNYILYKIFLLIFLISLLTENILDRQVGIVFFSYFNSIFFILKETDSV